VINSNTEYHSSGATTPDATTPDASDPPHLPASSPADLPDLELLKQTLTQCNTTEKRITVLAEAIKTVIALSARKPTDYLSYLELLAKEGASKLFETLQAHALKYPPVVLPQTVRLQEHGVERKDDFQWLHDKDSPEVQEVIKQESAYARIALIRSNTATEELIEELSNWLEQDFETAPVRYGDYLYFERYSSGADYPIYCRKPLSGDQEVEILLDVNKLAAEHDYFDLALFEPSPDNRLLAYMVDSEGNEHYTLKIIDLVAKRDLDISIPDTAGAFAWANDSQTFYYNSFGSAERAACLWRANLENFKSPEQIYFEQDPALSLEILRKTSDERFVIFSVENHTTAEVYAIDGDNRAAKPRLIFSRDQQALCQVDHHGDHFYLRTDLNAPNFTLLRSDQADPLNYESVLAGDSELLFSDFKTFASGIVVVRSRDGLASVAIFDPGSRQLVPVKNPTTEEIYSLALGDNWSFDSNRIRFDYSSFLTPSSVLEYDPEHQSWEWIKQRQVPAAYDRDQYSQARLTVRSPDGSEIPLSIVYKGELSAQQPRPILLTGYGAYGSSYDITFDDYPVEGGPYRMALLDRGVVYAVAHVRGGTERGKKWYEDGKLLKKQNSFTDFISCAEELISAGYTTAEQLFIEGRSAGGLLIGAVVNMRPELFGGAIMEVPFLDVLTTMQDPEMPLVVPEYSEWGNPSDPDYYHYMRAYSPYDNIREGDYPPVLLLAGVEDTRVDIREPLKFTARLRHYASDHASGKNLILFSAESGPGHAGKSGRYEHLLSLADKLKFLLGSKKVANQS